MNAVIWVNEKDEELGIVPREQAHREGLLHRIVVVYCTRPNGDILVQERMSGRLDHSAAGHVDPVETYADAAARELKEELGISCALNPLGVVIADSIEPNGHIRHLSMVYKAEHEPGVLAQDEVKSVFWANPNEILADMHNDPRNEKYTGGFKASLQFFLNSLL